MPIFIFLFTLLIIDSYKLVKLRSLIQTIFIGSTIALVAYVINTLAINELNWNTTLYSRYISPIIEESLKASVLIYLIKSKKVGFMVDAAIYGIAVGAGFACTENIFYLLTLNNDNILLWLIRGFGTALMHGGTTAIMGIISRNLHDLYPLSNLKVFFPGLAIAIIIHSFFNHFFLSPVNSTVLIVLILPILMMIIFKHSEESTRTWLGRGLDSDLELLNLLVTENLSNSRIGVYLHSLKSRLPANVVGDMLCYIRVYTELGMRAKGILILRQAGFEVPPDRDVKEKLVELKYLEKSIGATGKLAISPILHMSSRNLWQLGTLEE
ncbi:MAG: PrsW family intramembrane metalloprotease [Ignavibacteriales bacterium]|nr:PrsW family intramembrane metalloprotease [Ignavibacteriales bacterium]